jgi:carotenoid 1,2-hydratase
VSDDGVVVVIIALIGNPFSPAYARARIDAASDPRHAKRALDFCAMNVAIYGPKGRAWALRETPVAEGDRSAHGIAIGASSMQWKGDELVVDITERTTPFGKPIRGRITFRPSHRSRTKIALDAKAAHHWQPVATAGEIDVALDTPRIRFRGHGYHDTNDGDAPIDRDFSHWNWSRASIDRGATMMTYDVLRADGVGASHAIVIDRHGEASDVRGLVAQPLPRTGWRIDRTSRAHERGRVRVVRELEDTPFYARALVETTHGGRALYGVHETLSATRLRKQWVRFLLGFRMGRAAEIRG